jgi:DNA-binding GntR family transcriptional regulator
MAPPKPSSRLKAVPDEPAAPRPIQRPAGLVDEVYNRVRDDIMSLKIPPDTRITIESLARSLGVSQTPIREALSMLEAKGLVTKQHLIGYCTAPILNRAQFENIHEIRLIIEPYAARMAARKMSNESVAELGRLLAKMRPKKDDSRTTYDQFAELDAEFHERIAEATGNPLIADSLSRMHIHLHIFRLCYRSSITGHAHDEHEVLLKALEEHDEDAAEAAMRAHIQRSYERFAQFAKA